MGFRITRTLPPGVCVCFLLGGAAKSGRDMQKKTHQIGENVKEWFRDPKEPDKKTENKRTHKNPPVTCYFALLPIGIPTPLDNADQPWLKYSNPNVGRSISD